MENDNIVISLRRYCELLLTVAISEDPIAALDSFAETNDERSIVKVVEDAYIRGKVNAIQEAMQVILKQNDETKPNIEEN